MATKADILKRGKCQIKLVKLKTLGDVHIKELSASDVTENAENEADSYRMVALSLCDDEGNAILTADEIKTLSMAAFTELSNAIMELNGLSQEAEKSLEKK